jgi:hypothetical protein
MSFPAIFPFRLCTASPDAAMAVTITFPVSVTSTKVTPPLRFPIGVTSEEPLFPRKYAFFVSVSETKRNSDGFDSFFSPEGDAASGKLHVKLKVAAWLIQLNATDTSKSGR